MSRLSVPAVNAYTPRMRSLTIGLLTLILGATAGARTAPDWSRFRGPNGSGISTATKVPTEFGPDKNLLWRLPLPQGHSSPILQGDRIYLTALRDDTLVTIAIDRGTGKILWERGAPQVKTVVVDKRNNPASPSPAVEDNGVYVFFPDYGLIAYDRGGKQLWAMPLGPFNNIYGMGASPVIVGDNVILACDQSLGSYVMAVNKRTGRVRVEGRSARSQERPLDADRLARAGRQGSDHPARFVPAHVVRRRHRQEAVVGRRAVVRDEVDAGDRRRHDLRQRLRRAGERSRQQGHRADRRRGVEDGRRRRQRRAVEGGVSEVHAGVLVRRRRSRHQRLADARTSGRTTARRSIPRTACSRFASAAPAT